MSDDRSSPWSAEKARYPSPSRGLSLDTQRSPENDGRAFFLRSFVGKSVCPDRLALRSCVVTRRPRHGLSRGGCPPSGLSRRPPLPGHAVTPFLAAGAKLIPGSCACMVFGCFGSGVKTLNPVKQAASWVRGDSPAVLPRGSSAPAPGPASLLPSEAGRPGTLRARGVWRREAVSSLGSGLSPPGLCFPRTPRGRGGHLVSSSPRRFSILAHAAPRPPLPSHSTDELSLGPRSLPVVRRARASFLRTF